MLRSILVLLMGLFITACGPVYHTFYHYEPPSTSEGKRCLNQCIQIKQSCVNSCGLQKSKCLQMNALLDIANNMLSNDERSYVSSTNSSYTCNKNEANCLSLCDTSYNDCYENCGGVVRTEVKCVKRCHKVQ